MKNENDFISMQKEFYDRISSQWNLENKDPVVGSFDAHNTFEYYEELFKNIDNTNELTMLDFACGPGRNIVKYWNRFKQIDGVDISAINLEKAKIWITHNNFDINNINLFHCNGKDLSIIEDNTYNIIMSTIAMQHICVYEIRYNYFKEFYRILKNNGIITIQMGFGDGHKNTANYYDNYYDASSTNGACDVKINNTDDIKNDLYEIGFRDFSYYITPKRTWRFS